MNVLIFGGTTESRILSRRLAELGVNVTVSVATDYGREEQGDCPGVTVLAGRRNQADMESLLEGIHLCVDATHPYAVEATNAIRAACQSTGVPYRRLLRPRSERAEDMPDAPGNLERTEDGTGTAENCEHAKGAGAHGHRVTVADAAEAAAYLEGTDGNILLANGVRELRRFSALPPARLFPRILPTHEGLSACEAVGIPHRNIIAIQGPFSQELNEALIRQYHISYLVTKDGGTAGGFPEKAAAAVNTGAALVLIRRPEESGEGMETIIAACEEMMGWK